MKPQASAGGRMWSLKLATLAILGMLPASRPIAAQETNPCLIPPPPFPLTEANGMRDGVLGMTSQSRGSLA
jgi:hypothetical protein